MSSNCPAWDHPGTERNKESIVSGMFEFQKFTRRNSKSHLLDHGDLKTWHQRIFADSVPLGYYAGNFRSDDQRYPCLRVNIGVEPHPGAPYQTVPDLMRDLSDEMRNRTIEVDSLGKKHPTPTDRARWVVMLAALYAGKFVRIHPFLNGNGRMSRLTANYIFDRYGYPPAYFNPFPRPAVGYARASEAAMVGNFNPMFQYLLTSLAGAVT